MIFPFNPRPTDAFGLTWIPEDLGNTCGEGISITPAQECSGLERDKLRDVCHAFINIPINIMEIGVNNNGENSFTQIMMKTKHPESKYFGVDIEDKSYLNDDKKNIYTLKSSSFEFNKVVKELNKKDIYNLDILFIDGEHSNLGAIMDWKYSILVNKGGVILIHDVHTHSGPNILMQIIDQDFFDVGFLTIEMEGAHGLGIAVRK